MCIKERGFFFTAIQPQGQPAAGMAGAGPQPMHMHTQPPYLLRLTFAHTAVLVLITVAPYAVAYLLQGGLLVQVTVIKNGFIHPPQGLSRPPDHVCALTL